MLSVSCRERTDNAASRSRSDSSRRGQTERNQPRQIVGQYQGEREDDQHGRSSYRSEGGQGKWKPVRLLVAMVTMLVEAEFNL